MISPAKYATLENCPKQRIKVAPHSAGEAKQFVYNQIVTAASISHTFESIKEILKVVRRTKIYVLWMELMNLDLFAALM